MAMNKVVKEDYCHLGDAMNMLVSDDASTLGGGSPLPATITTSGSGTTHTDFAGMMAKNTAVIIAALSDNNGGNNGGTQNTIATTTQKEVINYWRQWVFYCFKYGVNLRHNSPGCPKKGPNHQEDSIFTDKEGGYVNCDHF